MVGVSISNGAFVMWQTLFAITASAASITAGVSWLNRRIAKRSDIDKMREELSDVKDGNTKENTRIISLIQEISEEIKMNENRLHRHIEFGSHARGIQPNPMDGQNDE